MGIRNKLQRQWVKSVKKNVPGDIVLVFESEWFKTHHLFLFSFFSTVSPLLLKIWSLYTKCKDTIRHTCMLYTIIWYLHTTVVNNHCVKLDLGIKLCHFLTAFDEQAISQLPVYKSSKWINMLQWTYKYIFLHTHYLESVNWIKNVNIILQYYHSI